MLRDPNENLGELRCSTGPEPPALAGPESLADRGGVVRPTPNDSASEPDWRRALGDAVRDPFELCGLLDLPAELAEPAAAVNFPLLVPRGFIRRMQPGDPNDPLLLQVLPSPQELDEGNLPSDAVGDLQANPQPGLLHKYQGRALLILGGSCAVNCRYCFRRHFPYEESPRSEAGWAPALDYLQQEPSIHEVILSGGDPLINGDTRLERLFNKLASIEHLQTVRIHTRLPIVLPERVTVRLAQLLRDTRLNAVVVLHTNHANEIDSHVVDAAKRLLSSGALLFNQSVLLRGVNDSVQSLVDLSHKLIAIGVTPYYLHQIDRVPGSAHYETSSDHGVQLIGKMRKLLPGYAIPRFVQEVAGRPHKVVLA
ncbi:L-lysine 2,3-aminomutase [Planctomycetes bacterium MalM25]|nr:L-lysine 2,3-aminomutase [Planctomycetes bacterium MalM25]